MRGHIKKRATWEFVVDLGPQSLQHCPVCRKRYWSDRGRFKACPKCHGPEGYVYSDSSCYSLIHADSSRGA